MKQENKVLKEEIIRIYHEQGGVYGAPKIREELKKAHPTHLHIVVIMLLSIPRWRLTVCHIGIMMEAHQER